MLPTDGPTPPVTSALSPHVVGARSLVFHAAGPPTFPTPSWAALLFFRHALVGPEQQVSRASLGLARFQGVCPHPLTGSRMRISGVRRGPAKEPRASSPWPGCQA